jgi:hypothetical protein
MDSLQNGDNMKNDVKLKKFYEQKGNTGNLYAYDLTGSWRAVINQTHISHKRIVINCSSILGNPFHTLKLLKPSKKID